MEIRRVGKGWTIALTQSSNFVDRRRNIFGIFKAGFKLVNKDFKVIKQGRLF